MATFFERLYLEFTKTGDTAVTDVDRLASLQQNAADRRLDYANAREQARLTRNVAVLAAVAPCRIRMHEAETNYMVALQAWENRRSGQKSY